MRKASRQVGHNENIKWLSCRYLHAIERAPARVGFCWYSHDGPRRIWKTEFPREEKPKYRFTIEAIAALYWTIAVARGN
jgi:hypothetical protein